MLGLPDRIRACLFDLDGVLTDTASVHRRAWKAMFDEYLSDRDGDGFVAFDAGADYEKYVDGKPRDDGIRSFLGSRGITSDNALVADLGADVPYALSSGDRLRVIVFGQDGLSNSYAVNSAGSISVV